MQRLVVAATALLAGMGAVVVVTYLLVFSTGSDRAARAVPADSAVYVNVFLQPSSAQQTSLAGLLAKLPGFADTSILDAKIDQLAQRLLSPSGIDYRADLRPWLGNELAVALSIKGPTTTPQMLLLVAVKDPAVARAALPQLWKESGITFTAHPYRGIDVMVGETASYALLPDLLVIGQSEARVRAALDADANAVPSLADSADFSLAMQRVPADHLASAYVDLRAMLPAGTALQATGYSTAAVALVAEANGLHATGEARFDASRASEAARDAFALARTPSDLTAWMPSDTRVETTFFGLEQSFTALTDQLKADPSLSESADALQQLRTLAALGLGINVDRDLLPLLDGEAAVAMGGSSGHLQLELLLKPSDPAAATVSIGRMQEALVSHGASVTTEGGTTPVTVIEIPQVGTLAYAVDDGVVLIGPDTASINAAVEAHRTGASLATADRYRAAFQLAGMRGSTELWLDVG
ncbi:MAG: DUF3352 domain-containing protein, partial [Chloroflexota bacterium]|nr:DUF3352 domain-containing protein [Chloroflexota bacterium]